MKVARRLTLLTLLALTSAFAAAGVIRYTRTSTPPPLVIDTSTARPAPGDPLAVRILERYTGMHVVPGNDVEVLLNGDGTYPRLWNDLRGAHETITLQSYYALPGTVSDTLRSILIERARAGVRVLLLFDAFGSQAMRRSWRDDLRRAGVEVADLRTLEWSTLHGAANRSHVRAIVIDGRVGYTGGFGFADYWLGNGRQSGQWRETNVRIEGPAVAELQAAFGAAWVETTGMFVTGTLFFPDTVLASHPGQSDAGLFYSAPTVGSTSAERYLTLMIAGARRRLYITNSYFVPNASFRRLLTDAAARHVDVRVLTTSANTDVRTTWLAGRYHYDELLAGGVRIFEYEPAMMHAKTIVVDGIWSSIGSMNFDNRSLGFNDEAILVSVDPTVGQTMEAAFADDLRRAHEIRPDEFDARSWWERIQEIAAIFLSRVL